MSHFYWLSAVLVVGANVAYHIGQKSVPAEANPALSIIVTYVVALVLSLGLLPFFPVEGGLGSGLKGLNWASAFVGLSIVGVEIGYLLFYRSGWSLSVGPIFSYLLVSLVLIGFGFLLFKERLSMANYLGVGLAMVSIFLMAKE